MTFGSGLEDTYTIFKHVLFFFPFRSSFFNFNFSKDDLFMMSVFFTILNIDFEIHVTEVQYNLKIM